MSYSKELWIAEIERICEDFALERITRDSAAGRLVSMGLDPGEAETMLNEAIS